MRIRDWSSDVCSSDLTGPIYATAAATCSSLASLAVALRIAQERLKLPRHIYSLTIPLGSQLSKEGTAIMLAAVLIFTAQASGVSFKIGRASCREGVCQYV